MYRLLKGAQNVDSSINVPFRDRKVKNGEKSCERYYLPVCSRLTREGDRSKRLDGHEKRRSLGMRGFSFFLFYFANRDEGVLNVQENFSVYVMYGLINDSNG